MHFAIYHVAVNRTLVGGLFKSHKSFKGSHSANIPAAKDGMMEGFKMKLVYIFCTSLISGDS